ncbi:MAG TPA: Uma2 family endonuclease, partial [Polyangiaceae bacterium]|nr:Uma2 family endonuclease [Polyangiaceae bacterium]
PMQAILTPTMQSLAVVSLRYPVRPNPEAWVIPEGPVPESTPHQAAVYRIYSLLTAWAERVRGERSVRISQELAVRWLEQYPRTGIDPDVAVLEPAPSDFDDLTSLRLWEPGRVPPRLAIEVVSASHPYKDYGSIQERYAAMGAEELLVFDPLLSGPRSLGGPVPLQLWRRDSTLSFERLCFGAEPVHSLVLDAWFIAEGRIVHIADDRRGTRRWLTHAEQLAAMRGQAERANAEAKRANAEAERERQAREALEQRVRELEGTKRR